MQRFHTLFEEEEEEEEVDSDRSFVSRKGSNNF